MATAPAGASATRVEYEGIQELRAALRALDSTLPRRLRVAGNTVAERIVVESQAVANQLGSVAAKASPSVRVASDQQTAAVKIGNAANPWALGAEFGSKHYHQFKEWTGNKWTDPENLSVGYFLHPTIRVEVASGRVRDEYDKAIAELTKIAFPK